MCLAGALAACNNANAGAGLPPAQGSGAAAPPSLGSASTESSTAAADEPKTLSAVGTTNPIRSADLAAQAGGMIRKVYVEEGDRVKKSQVVFRVDSAAQGIEVAQSNVGLETAKSDLEAAQRDYKRNEGLFKSGAISEAALQDYKDKLTSAELSVRRSEVTRRNARQSAAETVVRSPIAGIVSAKNKSTGESVSKDSTVVLSIQDISELEVRARLPESALAKVRPGDPVRVRFQALNITRDVTLTRINPSVDAKTRTIEVVVVVPNPDEQLRAGMLVRVEFPQSDAKAQAKK